MGSGSLAASSYLHLIPIPSNTHTREHFVPPGWYVPKMWRFRRADLEGEKENL